MVPGGGILYLMYNTINRLITVSYTKNTQINNNYV